MSRVVSGEWQAPLSGLLAFLDMGLAKFWVGTSGCALLMVEKEIVPKQPRVWRR